MELTKHEVIAVAEVTNKAAEQQIVELVDLQLALVGGGIGEVIVA